MSGLFRLSAARKRTLAAIAHVSCPGDLDALGATDQVVGEVELTMASFPPLTRGALVGALIAFEWLAALRPWAPGWTFRRLSPERRERYFAAWWHHRWLPIRQAIRAVHGLIAMAYYELPPVRDRLGYHPEQWIEEVKARRLERFGDEIRVEEALVTTPDPLVPASSLARSINRRRDHDDAA